MADPVLWTPEREEELARLWRAGVGAGAIAALLGFTRNAVLGKVHRLRRRPGGVMRFEARATTPPKRKPKRVKRSVPVPKQKPKVTHVAVAANHAKLRQNSIAAQKTAKVAGPLT